MNSPSTFVLSDCSYVAWALNTGPADVTPLWKGSRWITGQWTGINKGLDADSVRADLDARVQCLMQSFAQARARLSDLQRQRALNVFVTPEFYFHAKEGPYPNVRINGLPPFDYLRESLRTALSKTALLPSESWIFLSGSVMTCSESDFGDVIQSPEARARLAAINEALPALTKRNGFRSAADFHGHGPHIKGLSYSRHALGQQDDEKAIDALMNDFRANPLCVVRNRCLAFTLSASGVSVTGNEKQNESTVDLTMGILTDSDGKVRIDPAGMITEWIAGYPSISIINGDKQVPATPLAARYTVEKLAPAPLQIGVEICLDHRLQRLRRTVNMTATRGAAADNPQLHLQLIPSGGMQILDASVSAGIDGVMFNSDGCDPILDVYTADGKPVIEGSGTFKQITAGVYASSAQTLVRQGANSYYSHSQLCFRTGGAMESYDNARGNINVKGDTYTTPPANRLLDAYPLASRIPPEIPASPGLFSAGFGELHLYAKS